MIRNLSVNPFSDVYVAKAEEYNISKLTDSLSEISKRMQLPSLVGKRVVIKPNLVAKKSPDDPAIVNPAVIEAVIIWLKGLGADDITIAESPGGVYSIPRLKGIYSASGVAEVAARKLTSSSISTSDTVKFRIPTAKSVVFSRSLIRFCRQTLSLTSVS